MSGVNFSFSCTVSPECVKNLTEALVSLRSPNNFQCERINRCPYLKESPWSPESTKNCPYLNPQPKRSRKVQPEKPKPFYGDGLSKFTQSNWEFVERHVLEAYPDELATIKEFFDKNKKGENGWFSLFG